MIPILICLPYWEGDRYQAVELCRIVAGLQSGHAELNAHVMLINRQDCMPDPHMVDIISQKFHVHTFQSRSPLKGWPQGSNGMFGSTMIHIANSFKDKYECVYWMEPDAIPLCPNWSWNLVQAWRAKHPKALIIGCRSDCNGDGTGDHITGCAIYHPNIARLMPYLTTCSGTAWDYEFRSDIVQVGGHTNLIENWYRARNAEPGILDRTKVGVNIIHGFKDDSLINLVKNKYNIR